jgi:putative flippase GtrA
MKQSLFQLGKFAIIGTSNTAIDALLYFVLTRGFTWFDEHKQIAVLIAFLIAGINGFIWNRKWTFKVQKKYQHAELGKFYLANGGALLLNQFGFFFLLSFGLYDLIAKVFAGIAAGVVNFLLQKVWAFAEHEIEEIVHQHEETEAETQQEESPTSTTSA